MQHSSALIFARGRSQAVHQLSTVALWLIATFTIAPQPAAAQDLAAQAVIETMRKKQQARWAGVKYPHGYIVDQSNTNRNVLYYTRADNRVGFRLVQPAEVSAAIEDMGGLDYPTKVRIVEGLALGTAGAYGLTLGLPLSKDDQKRRDEVTIGVFSFFAASVYGSQDMHESRQDAIQAAAHMAEFEKVATFAGVDYLEGKEALLLVAKDLNRKQRTENGEFTLNDIRMWVDSDSHVMLGLRMDGVMASGKDTRPVTIFRHDEDHRRIGSLLEPYKTTVALSGVLSQKQLKEIQSQVKDFEKSKAEMEAFKAQLANMPQAQRDMIMGPMRSQMTMLENMESQFEVLQTLAKDNEIAMVTVVNEIRFGDMGVYVGMLASALGIDKY